MLQRSEGLVDWTKHHLQEIQGICQHVSGRSSDQSTQLGHLSHLDSRYRSRSQKITILSSVDFVWELCFYVGTIQRICLISDDLYSDSTLTVISIVMKECTDIGARPQVCGVFLMIFFNICLNSHRWFTLHLVFISYLVLVLMSSPCEGRVKYLYCSPASRRR
jgi:hypothetical protein